MTYVKQAPWIELGKELIKKYPICQYCGKGNSTQLAHALFHKRYLNRASACKKINVRYNALPCGDCCQKFSETAQGRQHAWKKLCEREGYAVMREWYDNVDMKIKESFK